MSIKILGNDVKAARPAIREMARNNLIQNPEKWLSFIDSRNEISHVFDEDVALKVYLQIITFLPEVTQLIKTFEKQK